MADNTPVNTATGAPGAVIATVASDDIGGGVVIQRVKVNYGPDGSTQDVDDTHPLPAALNLLESSFSPGYDGPSSTPAKLNTDPEGQLRVRGAMLTDESSFRVNFANTSLAVSIGSPTRAGSHLPGSLQPLIGRPQTEPVVEAPPEGSQP